MSLPLPSRPAPFIDLSAAEAAVLKVCTRPFRDAGPRLEEEAINGRRIIHNYGHGGGGWSLSWGCAEEVLQLARPAPGERVAVVGAGAMGLTAATRLAEAGAAVTLYSDRPPNDTRSARATGTWSPDSRVALKAATGADFAARILAWSRVALDRLKHDPAAEPAPRFSLREEANPAPRRDPIGFFKIDPAETDVIPPRRAVDPAGHGFAVPFADIEHRLTFDITRMTEALAEGLEGRGARIVRRHFASLADLLALEEPLIVNCTGYGARALLGDRTLRPIRGQVAVLPPQPGVRYGVDYRGGALLARPDAIIVQDRGTCESWGFDDGDETADTAEFARALALFRGVLSPAAAAI